VGLVWDTIRGLAFAQMLVVVVLTAMIVRRAIIEARTLKQSWRKALPLHIWQVGIGTALISIGYGATAIERLGGGPPAWYGAPFGAVAFTLLILGLWTMVGYQNRSYKSRRGRHTDPLDVDVPKAVQGGGGNMVNYILYAVSLVALIVLAYQVSGILEHECKNNNKQDTYLGGLIAASLEGARDPEVRTKQGRPAEVSPAEEKQIKKFEQATAELLAPEDCTPD
jgi:hypothetical protein